MIAGSLVDMVTDKIIPTIQLTQPRTFPITNYPTHLSSNVRMIKSRRVRWAGHVECMGEMRNAYTILIGKSRRKTPSGEDKG
jgi:hypothetical protein